MYACEYMYVLLAFAECNAYAQDTHTHTNTNKILFYCAAFMFYAFSIFFCHFYHLFYYLTLCCFNNFSISAIRALLPGMCIILYFLCICSSIFCCVRVYELNFFRRFPINWISEWILLQDLNSVVGFATVVVVVGIAVLGCGRCYVVLVVVFAGFG